MSVPTPRQAAPTDVRRLALVAEVMEAVRDVESLPLAEQSAALSEAQRVLAGVLSNDPSVLQQGIPGLAR